MTNEHSEDDLIKPLQRDKHGAYRMVDGKKIYQIEEKSQQDNLNRSVTSDMSPGEYLAHINKHKNK